jgi:DMSO/TMAO reductase YedYZ molybdopterin-dependent catalytic subunit
VLHEWNSEKEKKLPPNQADIENFRILSARGVPRADTRKWKLRIFGEVEEEKGLSYDDILSLPVAKIKADVHCVEGWSILDTEWEGIRTEELKKIVEIKDSARFVIVHCAEGYTTNLMLEDFFAKDSLLAYRLNGEQLSVEQGYPLRLVVPRLYLWKSAKWVNAIEFSEKDRKGYWEQRGYHNHGDPWKEERFSD